jgi:endonuclease YncB( thermonuclease family)
VEKPKLTVQKLVRAGFEQVGCWELSTEQKLSLQIKLPESAGVYGRKLRTVEVNGTGVGDALVNEGLARPYAGGRRPWC